MALASMNCAERSLAAATAIVFALFVAGCGGNSTETKLIGGGIGGGSGATAVTLDVPTGPNTTEIVVDPGPASGFSLGAANIPYVTVTVCTPGSSTDCVMIDHVFLDTGSVGFRVLRSAVARLSLPPIAATTGHAVECYPFVLGAVWGALASADVRVAEELASSIPVQLIDDSTPPNDAVPADCLASANGGLLNSAASLQANGILGVGMLAYDCGLSCASGNYGSGYALYYSCPGVSAGACAPTGLAAALQMQNPVAHFAVNNNGTAIAMPALPDLGAGIAKGRLVFGIGTQKNNQIPLTAKMYSVDANTASLTYLFLTTTVGATTYTDSYIDSGSNALFFDDASVAQGCQSSAGSSGGWYCPPTVLRRTATITGATVAGLPGNSGSVDYSVANADALFSASSVAFADLAGSVMQGSSTFVWGLPFFFGRTVFTSIWGQALSPNGPWNAF
jgi:hypothetical protein